MSVREKLMQKPRAQELQKEFPNIYRNGCPYAVGEGWFDLVRELSRVCEEEVLLLPEEERENFWVFTIKEKFGGLRFYFDSAAPSERAMRMVADTESKSFHICEQCGAPGTLLRSGGIPRVWFFTACGPCNEKRDKKGVPTSPFPQCFYESGAKKVDESTS